MMIWWAGELWQRVIGNTCVILQTRESGWLAGSGCDSVSHRLLLRIVCVRAHPYCPILISPQSGCPIVVCVCVRK